MLNGGVRVVISWRYIPLGGKEWELGCDVLGQQQAGPGNAESAERCLSGGDGLGVSSPPRGTGTR